ncbi:hypothetical protein HYG86_08120 [Alkalicella caledoniensis]|uniref:Uncharacterized protein n=1 Tax=Alkalicella caledoniensis TaxID=2731377 RepID=A0A7G9W7U2_ALKCA|nr:hypothetical protein [Alkalicella caledoniensis]QNO14754.1 hypothetical protein HYG86_08120 [Alkalicella caledoniensis]
MKKLVLIVLTVFILNISLTSLGYAKVSQSIEYLEYNGEHYEVIINGEIGNFSSIEVTNLNNGEKEIFNFNYDSEILNMDSYMNNYKMENDLLTPNNIPDPGGSGGTEVARRGMPGLRYVQYTHSAYIEATNGNTNQRRAGTISFHTGQNNTLFFNQSGFKHHVDEYQKALNYLPPSLLLSVSFLVLTFATGGSIPALIVAIMAVVNFMGLTFSYATAEKVVYHKQQAYGISSGMTPNSSWSYTILGAN